MIGVIGMWMPSTNPIAPSRLGAFREAGDCGSPWRCRRCHFWRGSIGALGLCGHSLWRSRGLGLFCGTSAAKTSGWWGPGLVGLCYEGLPWFTGAAVLSAGAPDWRIILLAGLYALGAHGIMTLNDFKATEGDRQLGINSLPVTLGSERAARLACWIMAVPQAIIIALLVLWDRPVFALILAALLAAQFWAMGVMLTDPKARAPWYNATGVSMYVSGMMISAIALRGLL